MIIIHMLLMLLAVILAFVGVYQAIKKKAGWFLYHRRLGASSLISALVSFSLLFYFKFSHHYGHFKSPHAQGGVLALIMLLLTVTFGLLAAKGHPLSRKLHRLIALLTLVLLLSAMFFGFDRFVDMILAQHK